MKVFKLFILACLFSSSSAYAVLSNNLTATVQGNVVSSGVGLRGTGTGDIVVSGVPGGASVSQAFLYWVTMGNSDTFTSPTLDGSPVSGSLIGTGGDTCWGAAGNYTYRADVTSTVTGNGTYTIAGLPNSGPSVDDSQGASLVVIYEDGASAVHNVVINDGSVTLDTVGQNYTDTLTGFNPATPPSATLTLLVGDGQNAGAAVTFNGNSIATTFPGADGAYWDTASYDVSAYITDPSDVDIEVTGDCLVWAASILSVESDDVIQSAPRSIPTLSQWGLILLSMLVGFAALGRRKIV